VNKQQPKITIALHTQQATWHVIKVQVLDSDRSASVDYRDASSIVARWCPETIDVEHGYNIEIGDDLTYGSYQRENNVEFSI
jgi:hypothetical protein